MKAVEPRRWFLSDIIIAHMGWGEGLYLKRHGRGTTCWDILSGSTARGADVGFADSKRWTSKPPAGSTRNGLHLQSLTVANHGISPPIGSACNIRGVPQQDLDHPPEGVNTDLLKPDPSATRSRSATPS